MTSTTTANQRTIFDLATASMDIEGTVRHDFESTVFAGWPIEAKDRATIGSLWHGHRQVRAFACTTTTPSQSIPTNS